MISRNEGKIVALLLWLACGNAVAAPGFLYQIDRGDTDPSYLLGTIHVDDPEVARVLPRVRPLLARCRLLMLELLPDGTAMLAAMRAGMLPPGEQLSDLLDPDLYAAVRRLASARGMPEAILQRQRPWSIATTLSLPADSGGNFLDLRLYQMAQELRVPATGLEGIDEQIAVFDRLELDQQRTLLRHAVKESDAVPQKYAALLAAYLAGDLERLGRLARDEAATLPQSLETWYADALLDDRNGRMLQRLLPEVARGGVMVAVGALHLDGPGGLLAGLRAAGYRVRLQER